MVNGLTHRIAKNSLFSLGRNVLSIPVLLLITPYTIGKIGVEEFGLWALVGILSSYAQLSDFGITESLTKYIAEHHALGDDAAINRLVNTSFVLYVGFGLLGAVVLTIGLDFIVSVVLQIPEMLRARVRLVFLASIAIFLFNIVFSVFGTVIVGFQRLDITNKILSATLLIGAGTTVLFLESGYRLEGLVLSNAVTAVIVVICQIFFAKKLFPELSLSPRKYFRREAVSRILSFAWKIQLSNATQILIFQLDRILLSRFVGLAAVGHYEIASRIASQVRMLVISLFAPMVPAASALHATEEEDVLTGLYRRSLKYMAATAIPMSVIVISLAHPFIRTWMGEGYDVSSISLQLLTAAFMVNLMTGPGAFVLNGINKPHIGMFTSIVGAAVNITACLLLVGRMGYFGVIAGIVLALALSALLFFVLLHKHLPGIRLSYYREIIVPPLLFSSIPGVLLLLLEDRYQWAGYPGLFVASAAFATIVVTGLVLFDYFDDFDKNLLKSLCGFGGGRT